MRLPSYLLLCNLCLTNLLYMCLYIIYCILVDFICCIGPVLINICYVDQSLSQSAPEKTVVNFQSVY